VSAVTSRIAQWTLDVQDVGRMAEFWSQVLGADVGQTGDEGFVVLADPEGNEFCILR
jgi:catechol-2,3-dioxygenase